MKVLVLYGAWHVGARIAHCLSKIKGLTVVCRSRSRDESIGLIAYMRPNVVILDAEMGQGEGVEVLRSAKTMEAPPIVVVTAAVSHSHYRWESTREGADYFFQVPTEIESMMKVVVACAMRIASGREPEGQEWMTLVGSVGGERKSMGHSRFDKSCSSHEKRILTDRPSATNTHRSHILDNDGVETTDRSATPSIMI